LRMRGVLRVARHEQKHDLRSSTCDLDLLA
jgi:hypothetical protein